MEYQIPFSWKNIMTLSSLDFLLNRLNSYTLLQIFLNKHVRYFQAFTKALLPASFCDTTDTSNITPNTQAINQYSKSSFNTSNILEGCTRVWNKSESRRNRIV